MEEDLISMYLVGIVFFISYSTCILYNLLSFLLSLPLLPCLSMVERKKEEKFKREQSRNKRPTFGSKITISVKPTQDYGRYLLPYLSHG